MKIRSYIYLNLVISAMVAFMTISPFISEVVIDDFFDGRYTISKGIISIALAGLILQCLSLFLYKTAKLGKTLAIIGSLPFLPLSFFYIISYVNKIKRWNMRGFDTARPTDIEKCDKFQVESTTAITVFTILMGLAGIIFNMPFSDVLLVGGILSLLRNKLQKRQPVIGVNPDFLVVSLDPALKSIVIPMDKVRYISVGAHKLVITVITQDNREFSINLPFSRINSAQHDALRNTLKEKNTHFKPSLAV